MSIRPNRFLTLCGATALVSVLHGCFAFDEALCETPADIASVRVSQPIRVPDDLDGLDESQALEIPTATTPPPQEGQCLERPPSYAGGG